MSPAFLFRFLLMILLMSGNSCERLLALPGTAGCRRHILHAGSVAARQGGSLGR